MNSQQKDEFSNQELKNTSNNITSVGFGWKTTDGKLVSDNAVIYNVTEKKPWDQIPEDERIPSRITINGETFDTDVVEGKNELQTCSQWTAYQSSPPTNRNSFRPLKGGISVTNYTQLSAYVGTLGFIAIDDDDGKLVGISNNHVLTNDAFYTSERNNAVGQIFAQISGSVATQPNESGNSSLSNRIGLVKKYVPIVPIGSLVDNTVDAAAISIDPVAITSGLIDTSESWKQEGFTTLLQAPPFASTAEIDAALADPNTAYYSSGRTTGMKGLVVNHELRRYQTNQSITINYPLQGVDTTVYMKKTFSLMSTYYDGVTLNQCTYPSAGGDSGSAILADIGGVLKIVGLLYGGTNISDVPTYTLCNRIDEVASQLNISAWDGISTNYAAQTVTTRVISGTSSNATVGIGTNTYWQVGLVNNATNPPNYP